MNEIAVDGLKCTAVPLDDDHSFQVVVCKENKNTMRLVLVLLGCLSALIVSYLRGGVYSLVSIAITSLFIFLWMRRSISKEEVLLVEDSEANCVRVQCRSFDQGNHEHDLRRAHVPIDAALDHQVVVNECFVNISSVRDILGFIAIVDSDPTIQKTDRDSCQQTVESQKDALHENDSFVPAFEHFLPRLNAVEVLYNSIVSWLSRVAQRHHVASQM